MNFAEPGFVIALVAISMVAWVITTAIRARHGYPLTDDWGNTVHNTRTGDDDTTKALKSENLQLRETVGKLEERLMVLERIATDPAKRLSDDIENLRS